MHTNRTRSTLALFAAFLVPAPAPAAPGGETLKLLAGDGATNDFLGRCVGVSGGVAVCGAHLDGDNGLFSGSAYLFDVATGQQLAKLLASDGGGAHHFGEAVAIGGGVVVAGAHWHAGNGQRSGAAYLFDVASGHQLFKLVPSDNAMGDEVGFSVGVAGGTAIVGAPYDEDSGNNSGSAWLFDVMTGQETLKLLASDGAVADRFGFAVGTDGATLIVGAPGDADAGQNTGAAYLFDPATGAQRAKLVAGDGASGDAFGAAVAVAGGLAVIGAPGDDDGGPSSGSAYLFDVVSGQQLFKLLANDAATSDDFGISVALEGTTVVVGAESAQAQGYESGAAYLFDATTGQQIAKLLPSDGAVWHGFGASVSIDAGAALVGAWGDDENASAAGAAYLFDATAAIAAPYCFGDGSGAACPCANTGDPAHGCANSAFASGCRLRGMGAACVSVDGLFLQATSSRPLQPGVFLQGDQAAAGGVGLPFGDGLRCAEGHVRTIQLATADLDGSARTTIPLAATAGISAGDVKRYQWWYRDPGSSLCGSGFNLSNGLEVVWGP